MLFEFNYWLVIVLCMTFKFVVAVAMYGDGGWSTVAVECGMVDVGEKYIVDAKEMCQLECGVTAEEEYNVDMYKKVDSCVQTWMYDG